MQRLAQDGEIDRPFSNRRIFDVAQPVFEICEAALAVSFLSLGLRPGLVVALAIPLVLAMTFVALEYLGISLQRISLGALIIALGLLVMRWAESARSSIPLPPPAAKIIIGAREVSSIAKERKNS